MPRDRVYAPSPAASDHNSALQAVEGCESVPYVHVRPMNSPPDDPPLLIAVSDLFRGHRSRTLRSVAEQLNVSEPAAMAALERLERLNVLVRSRGGTDTPVWTLRPRSTEDHVNRGGSVTPS
ncbi:hypothetical protein [Salinigranum sp. GCM10025319]|uniref:hypothetical protein n=1 Tax=Salinigranum sp. GCM10025319 TaxID=3252687 RepID=UPI0036068119